MSLAGLSIVIVDDDRDARELLQEMLIDAGAEVHAAGTAAEGLALVQVHRPDVIVSDIGMPARDGYQLMRDVRALDAAAGGATPAIAVTAFVREGDRTRAMQAGFQAHVAKPIELPELTAAVASVVVTRRR